LQPNKADTKHIQNILGGYISLGCKIGNLQDDYKELKHVFKQEAGKKPEVYEVLTYFNQVSTYKIVLLLAETGMGKTMTMQKTFVKLASQYPDAALAFVYCGVDTDRQIEAIFKQRPDKKLILFIDAFDEDIEARKGDFKARFRNLCRKVAGCQKVYISCRNHLFESPDTITDDVGIKGVEIAHILVGKMEKGKVMQFIAKKYEKDQEKFEKAKARVKGKEETLYYRPLILSNLDLLFDTDKPIHFEYQLYEALLRSWARREILEKKIVFAENEESREKVIDDLMEASKKLAKHIYEQGEKTTAEKIENQIGLTAEDLATLTLWSEPKRMFVKREGDKYFFAHQAFYDFFIAQLLYSQELHEEDLNQKAYAESMKLYAEMLCDKVLQTKEKVDLIGGSYFTDYDSKTRDLLTVSNNLYIRALVKKHIDKGVVFEDATYLFKVIEKLQSLGEKHYFLDYYANYQYCLDTCSMFIERNYFVELFLQEIYQLLNKELKLEGKYKDIWELKNLQKLYLWGNQLQALPESIGQLQNLQELELSSNQLQALPKSIGQLQNLQKLDLGNNPSLVWEDVFKQLKELPNLQILDLGDNQLQALPESIGQLQNLQELNLSINQLQALPESIGQLQNLQELHLGNNPSLVWEDVFKQLKELPNLQILGLSNNQLHALPESIEQLQNLRGLHLVDNPSLVWEDVFKQLKELPNLQKLELGGNQLTQLPEIIGQLQNLQELDLRMNQLQALPEIIGQLQNLQELDLRINQLQALPESIGQLKKLQILFLVDNQLQALPESIGQLKKLQILFLGDNQLQALPESIGQLKKLQKLYLSSNQLQALPESIGQLKKLQKLYLSSNQLQALPESIGQLQNLQELYLGDNPSLVWEDVFKQLKELPKLQKLDLWDNQLQALPGSIGQLQNLQELHLGNNPSLVWEDVFKQLKELPKLQKLDLWKNQLTQLPESIGQLQKLQELNLWRNNFSETEKDKIRKLLPNCKIEF
jgi:Leucine-rich repeat (LRR) protein